MLTWHEDVVYFRFLGDYRKYVIKKTGNIDFSLFSDCGAVIFFELEEYTYRIYHIVKAKYPDLVMIFLDKNAELFIENVCVCSNIFEAERYISNRKCVYITSKSVNEYTAVPDTIINIYNSINVMESLFWAGKHACYGARNKDRTILLIDCLCGNHGLVDIMHFTCDWVMVALEHGWVPVVDFSTFPNQYLQNEGDNMWEYFFEPVSEISVQEAMESYDVISLKENDKGFIMGNVNPYFRRANDYLSKEIGKSDYFMRIVKVNRGVKEYLEACIPAQIENKTDRVLGVVMRGTDYRRKATKKRAPNSNAFSAEVQDVIKRVRKLQEIWGYDYIFVATEDAGFLEIFKNEFHEKLLYVNQKRVDYDEENDCGKSVSKLLDVKGNQEFTKAYLLVLYALSKCNGLVSSMNCGARYIARSWNCGAYEVDEIVDNAAS